MVGTQPDWKVVSVEQPSLGHKFSGKWVLSTVIFLANEPETWTSSANSQGPDLEQISLFPGKQKFPLCSVPRDAQRLSWPCSSLCVLSVSASLSALPSQDVICKMHASSLICSGRVGYLSLQTLVLAPLPSHLEMLFFSLAYYLGKILLNIAQLSFPSKTILTSLLSWVQWMLVLILSILTGLRHSHSFLVHCLNHTCCIFSLLMSPDLMRLASWQELCLILTPALGPVLGTWEMLNMCLLDQIVNLRSISNFWWEISGIRFWMDYLISPESLHKSNYLLHQQVRLALLLEHWFHRNSFSQSCFSHWGNCSVSWNSLLNICKLLPLREKGRFRKLLLGY